MQIIVNSIGFYDLVKAMATGADRCINRDRMIFYLGATLFPKMKKQNYKYRIKRMSRNAGPAKRIRKWR